MKIDKQSAQKMREAGHTYKHIAQTLGCSEDWCKRNLSSITKNTKEKEILEQIKNLAQSKEGVTNQEIRNTIRIYYPNTFSKEDKAVEDKMFNKLKSQLRKEDKCLIRPYWLQPDKPNDSFIALMQATQVVSDRIEEEVCYFLNLFQLDNSYANSVRWAIVSLTYAGSKFGNGTDAQTTIDNLEKLVHELEERQLHTLHHIYTSDKKCTLNTVISEKSVFEDFVIPEYFDEVGCYLSQEL